MKLPSGKVTKTVAGGLDSFQGLLDECKSSGFTGYVSITSQVEGDASKGHLVIKEGQPVLADHEVKGSETIGASAVLNIIKDGLQAEANISLHSNVDVDIIIDFNTDAQVEASDLDLQTKAREIEAEEKKKREEDERRAAEGKRREELTAQIAEWKSNGYIVQKLESMMDGPLAEIENAFSEIGQAIGKLDELDKKLAGLNTKGFESAVDSIEMKLNNPESIAELEKEIDDLAKSIANRSKKEAELRKKIDNWKNEGYNVTRLETVIDTDFSKAWDAFTQFMDDLQKLGEYTERLKKLNTVGFEPMVEVIRDNLKNPDSLGELEQQFLDLDMRVNEAAERKAELQKQIDEWSSKGYKIDRFKDVEKMSLENVEQMIMDYDRDLGLLQELRSQFENLDKTDIDTEAKALESKFNDPDSIAQLTEELQKLTTKLEEVEERRRVNIDKIEEWRNMGYNIVSLEPQLTNAKVGQVEAAVAEFEQKIGKLNTYETVVDGLNLVGFDSESAAIREKLLDPDKIPELEQDLKNLKKKIDAAGKKRAELKKRVEGWKNEGFVVDSLEALIDGDLKVAWDAFTTMMDQTQTLNGLKEKLSGMDVTGYEDDAEKYTSQLNDPALASELEKLIAELDEKVKAEKQRRSEIQKQVNDWKKDGFVVEAFEKQQKAKLGELEPLFTDISSKIEKLKEFQGKAKNLKSPTYREDLKALNEKMKNPEALDQLDVEYTTLVAKISEEKSERDGLKSQMEGWKAEGFIVKILDEKINGNIESAKKASEELGVTIGRLQDYKSALDGMDLRDFKDEESTVKKLASDPGNLTQIETIMTQLTAKVDAQNEKRAELLGKITEWKEQGLVVDDLEKIVDEPFSVFEKDFKKFEVDLDKLLELQKKLGGASLPGKKPAPEGKAPEAAEKKVEAKTEAAKAEAKGEGAAKAEAKSGKEEVPKKLFSEFKLNKDFTFDTFVVGTSNRFTHAAALAVAESPADAYNPLFIYGGVGLGKTHLLNSIGNHILKNKKEANIIFVSSERFTNELINAVRYDKIDDFRNIYREADVLVIDDIQFLAGKESTQEEFFHTFNTLYNAHRQIVVSSDRPPKEIPKLEERLRSRFEGGLITDIQPPSLETKVIILRREAKRQNIDPPDEVVHYIASKVKTNIRELRGYLTKVSAYSSLTKQEITMELAQNVLKDLGFDDKEGGEAARPEAPAAAPDRPVAAAQTEIMSSTDGKKRLSNIEERLSSLKARLSPILHTNNGKPAEQEAATTAASTTPDNLKTYPEPQSRGGAAEVDDAPVAEPVITSAGDAGGGELAKCGNCGAIVPADVPECPECGVSFGGEWFECPECRSVVSADSPKCDNCGAEFEAVAPDEAPIPQPQVAPTSMPQPSPTGGKKKKKKKKK